MGRRGLTDSQKAKIKEIVAWNAKRKGTQQKAVELIESQIGVVLDRSYISKLLTEIEAEWLANSQRDIGTIKAQELAKLDLIDAESWEQFDRSKLNAETTTTKLVGVDEVKSNKAKDFNAFDDEAEDPRDSKLQVQTEETKKVSGQCGDPRYLQIIINSTKTRADILGLNAPVRQHVTSNVSLKTYGNVSPDDWNKVEQQIKAQIVQDSLDGTTD